MLYLCYRLFNIVCKRENMQEHAFMKIFWKKDNQYRSHLKFILSRNHKETII